MNQALSMLTTVGTVICLVMAISIACFAVFFLSCFLPWHLRQRKKAKAQSAVGIRARLAYVWGQMLQQTRS